MRFGVDTDSQLRPMKYGEVLENVYAVGAVLGGFDPLNEGCGAGVSAIQRNFMQRNKFYSTINQNRPHLRLWRCSTTSLHDNSFEACIKRTVCTTYCPVAKVNPLYPGPKRAGP